MIMKPCNKMGCTKLIPRGQSPAYCDEHRREIHKRYDARKDPERTAFYKSSQWQRFRQSVLIEYHYLCSECRKHNELTKADTVHHIVEISTPEGWKNRFSRDNCRPVCRSCHEKIHDRFSWNESR